MSGTNTIVLLMFYRRNRPTVISPSLENFNMSLMRRKKEQILQNLRSTSYALRVVTWAQRLVTESSFFLVFVWDTYDPTSFGLIKIKVVRKIMH